MQEKLLVKRNGAQERFNKEKINSRLQKLCYGLKCNVTKLSLLIFEKIYSGILTSELDKIAEGFSVEMGELDPEFLTLASRIFVSELHKKTIKKFSEYASFVSLDEFSDKDLEFKTSVDSIIIYDRDYSFSYQALKILESKYLLRHEGLILERPQQLLLRVAMKLTKSGDIGVLRQKYEELSTSVSFQDLVQILDKIDGVQGSSCEKEDEEREEEEREEEEREEEEREEEEREEEEREEEEREEEEKEDVKDQRVAVIFGITGQTGSYAAEKLLSKGYIVHGIVRRSSSFNTQRIEHIFKKVTLHFGDLTDQMSIFTILQKLSPDEIYNFAAQSHVKVSSELENYTFQVNTLGMLSILQSVKNLGLKTKTYFAGTSEEFGNTLEIDETPLSEKSFRKPCSIYGISKLASEYICNLYRDAYGMFIISATLFNHESPRRGDTFVTKKITNYVKKRNFETPLELGNLNSKRDWGFAGDYVEAIYLMMQQKHPISYVISTGETHSVREFCELAFKEIGVQLTWRGEGLDEEGIDENDEKVVHVCVNKKYYRDYEINCLVGDSSLAKKNLNWQPKTSFKELVKMMVNS
jgi:GDPmannose 4,6-dehydratase